MKKTLINIVVLLFSSFLLTACGSGIANLGRLVIGVGGMLCALIVHHLVSDISGKEETLWGIIAGLATLIGFVALASSLSNRAANIVAIIAIIAAVIGVVIYFKSEK